MKRIKKTILLCLSATALLGTEHTLTLDQAIDLALQNNAKLKVSQTAIEIADTMYNQAMSANYPTLDVDIRAMRLDEALKFQMRGVTTVDNTNTIALNEGLSSAAAADGSTYLSNAYAAVASATPATSQLPIEMEVTTAGRDSIISQLNMTYPLYTGGKISAIVKQASLGKKIAQETKRRTNNEVIFDVKRFYYGVLLTKQLKKLSEDTLERMGFIRDLTSRLYQGGSMNVKKTDYLRSKLSVNVLESMHEDLSQKELMAQSALIFAMGLPWSDSVEISQKEFVQPVMSDKLESLIEDAYKFNPDYANLKIAIDIHDAKIDAAQSDYLPSIGLMASAQNIYNDYEYGIVNDTNKNSWTIGVGIQWSLFNGMRTTNQVEQSRLEKLSLEQQGLILQDALALQVKQTFLQMKSSHKQFIILSEATKTAEENRDLNTRAYQEDMVQTKDVIESQLFESFTFAAYYRSLHAHAMSKINRDFIIGQAIETQLKK